MIRSVAAFPVTPRVRFRRHEHESLHVCAVLAGGFVERDGRTWRDVGPGMIRVSGAARHDIDFGPAGARCLVLETAGGADPAVLRRLARARFLEADAWLARVVGRLASALAQPDPARAVVVDGLSVELLAQLARRVDGRRGPPPPWLERVRRHLDDTRGKVSLAALASDAQVHRVHLARSFRDHFGVPVTEYARRVRLAVAQRLVLTTAVPLAVVAAQAGFADQSHLTRALRAGVGATPGALRRAALHRFKTAPAVPS